MGEQYKVIGESFIKEYYRIFDGNQRANLAPMYHGNALLTYEDNQVMGHKDINELLTNTIRFQSIQHVVTKCDCQPTLDNGVVVMVTGMLKTDDDPPHPFSEVFVLKMDNNNYFIFHHMFRLSIHNM